MGEEAKQEEAKPEVKAEENKEETKKDKPAEVKEGEEVKPPPPFILFVDLHCVGCAKKIEKSLMKIRGVEGVAIDMAQSQVTIKGIVEPQAVCNMIRKKTKRRAQVLSPLPEAEGEPMPQVVNSQVAATSTVELNVNMHCEACAEQLKKKILKMRGVQTAVTEVPAGKVIVTGTMDAKKLVDYIYRSTKKQAKIVPQPEPEPQPEAGTVAAENPGGGEDKKEEGQGGEEKGEEKSEAIKEAGGEAAAAAESNKVKEEAKKEGDVTNIVMNNNNNNNNSDFAAEDENMKRLMYYHHYQPLYVIERIPPPQLFSDENPNACCIS